jgi:hypothetical protein
MKSIIIFFALAFTPLLMRGQSKILRIAGVVSQKTSDFSKKPLEGASVYIPGIAGIATTNTVGYYELNLSKCTNCIPGNPVKIYVNSTIGYAEREFTLSGNPGASYDIDITENTKLALNGTVKDKKTGKLIKGIKVTALIQNLDTDPPSGITNDQGIFKIIIRKNDINIYQAIELVFTDVDGGKYRDAKEIVFINKIQTVDIEMEECMDCGSRSEMKIRRDTTTKIRIEAGDLVTIRANGTMRVGSFVGTSGPEGRTNGVLGLSLEAYNQDDFKHLNHAALLYRFGKDDTWKAYEKDKEMKYQSGSDGYLEFKINDKIQSDNSGFYQVEIIVKK